MKYLKLFESKSLVDIIEEIESLSYIMEDEGIPIKITHFKKCPKGWLNSKRCCTNDPFIEISLGSFIDERINQDFYPEWLDRMEELCETNGFEFVEQYKAHIFQIY